MHFRLLLGHHEKSYGNLFHVEIVLNVLIMLDIYQEYLKLQKTLLKYFFFLIVQGSLMLAQLYNQIHLHGARKGQRFRRTGWLFAVRARVCCQRGLRGVRHLRATQRSPTLAHPNRRNRQRPSTAWQ